MPWFRLAWKTKRVPTTHSPSTIVRLSQTAALLLSLGCPQRKLSMSVLPTPAHPLLMTSIQPTPTSTPRCRNFDGGFGCIPGAESHAGQIFTCVGALSIARSLHLVDEGERVFVPVPPPSLLCLPPGERRGVQGGTRVLCRAFSGRCSAPLFGACLPPARHRRVGESRSCACFRPSSHLLSIVLVFCWGHNLLYSGVRRNRGKHRVCGI